MDVRIAWVGVVVARRAGTIAGCGKRLKEASQGAVQVYLADVQGSSLFNKVMRWVESWLC